MKVGFAWNSSLFFRSNCRKKKTKKKLLLLSTFKYHTNIKSQRPGENTTGTTPLIWLYQKFQGLVSKMLAIGIETYTAFNLYSWIKWVILSSDCCRSSTLNTLVHKWQFPFHSHVHILSYFSSFSLYYNDWTIKYIIRRVFSDFNL